MLKPRVDMRGVRCGRCVGIDPVRRATSGDVVWTFLCDCGRTFEANGYDLRSGKRRDCPTCAAERVRSASVLHGLSESEEFGIWTGILTRCYNQNAKHYCNYGGRGIVMCEQWKTSFQSFYSDMGKRPSKAHSIDRIDNDGNYEPGNCRWATSAEQSANKRTTVRAPSADGRLISDLATQVGITHRGMWERVRRGKSADLLRPSKRDGAVTYLGVTDTIRGWSARTGIKTSTISMRLRKYGWTVEKALTTGAGPWAISFNASKEPKNGSRRGAAASPGASSKTPATGPAG